MGEKICISPFFSFPFNHFFSQTCYLAIFYLNEDKNSIFPSQDKVCRFFGNYLLTPGSNFTADDFLGKASITKTKSLITAKRVTEKCPNNFRGWLLGPVLQKPRNAGPLKSRQRQHFQTVSPKGVPDYNPDPPTKKIIISIKWYTWNSSMLAYLLVLYLIHKYKLIRAHEIM